MSLYRFTLAATGWILVLLASLATRGMFIDQPFTFTEAVAWVGFGCAPIVISAMLSRSGDAQPIAHVLYEAEQRTTAKSASGIRS